MIRQRFGCHRSRCERARFERKSGDTADKSAVARRKKKEECENQHRNTQTVARP